MSEPFIVRGYGRASTEEQVLSPEQQESVVKDAFELYRRVKPDWVNAVWGGFAFDEAVTRTKKFRERPVGSLVLATTKPRDVILVSNYDRIFANVVDVCETLELIEQKQFAISILDLDINISNDLGQAVFKILAVVKELEVKEIRRRAKDTSAYRRKAGLPHGPSEIGWQHVTVVIRGRQRKYYAPNPNHQALATRLLTMRQALYADVTTKDFVEIVNSKNIRHPSGRRWNQMSMARWLKAARQGFPLRNGSHEPTPIPPDAEPVRLTTLGDMN